MKIAAIDIITIATGQLKFIFDSVYGSQSNTSIDGSGSTDDYDWFVGF